MEELCEIIRRNLENIKRDHVKIVVEYADSGVRDTKIISMLIYEKEMMRLLFKFRTNKNQTPLFVLSLQANKWSENGFINMERGSRKIKSKREEILVYYKEIEKGFREWVQTKKQIRLQYMIDVDSVLGEHGIIKDLKKEGE